MSVLAHTGGYVAGAYLRDDLVAVAAGFLAHDTSLHSHVTGVLPHAQGHGIGAALKTHQRQWAAERGLSSITWTFDPLVRRNAYFNLARLDAHVEEYLPDFYGPMSDGINDGDVSDRLFVRWPVKPGSMPALFDEPAPLILDEQAVGHDAGLAKRVLCATPADVEALRRTDPRMANHWRFAMRNALGAAFDAGYRIIGCTRAGWYVLEIGDNAPG